MRRSRSPVLDHSIVDIYRVPGIQEYRSQFFHRRRQIRFDRLSLLAMDSLYWKISCLSLIHWITRIDIILGFKWRTVLFVTQILCLGNVCQSSCENLGQVAVLVLSCYCQPTINKEWTAIHRGNHQVVPGMLIVHFFHRFSWYPSSMWIATALLLYGATPVPWYLLPGTVP